MSTSAFFRFTEDRKNKKILVERSFNAPVAAVWAAFTRPEILDMWWAPKPWKAVTRNMVLKDGGHWHYCMEGPKNEKQWCLFEYETIYPEISYSGHDTFCDENGVPDEKQPRMHWHNAFRKEENITVLHIEISFKKVADMDTILEMGFKEGFSMALANLDTVLEKM